MGVVKGKLSPTQSSLGWPVVSTLTKGSLWTGQLFKVQTKCSIQRKWDVVILRELLMPSGLWCVCFHPQVTWRTENRYAIITVPCWFIYCALHQVENVVSSGWYSQSLMVNMRSLLPGVLSVFCALDSPLAWSVRPSEIRPCVQHQLYLHNAPFTYCFSSNSDALGFP